MSTRQIERIEVRMRLNAACRATSGVPSSLPALYVRRVPRREAASPAERFDRFPNPLCLRVNSSISCCRLSSDPSVVFTPSCAGSRPGLNRTGQHQRQLRARLRRARCEKAATHVQHVVIDVTGGAEINVRTTLENHDAIVAASDAGVARLPLLLLRVSVFACGPSITLTRPSVNHFAGRAARMQGALCKRL